MTQNKNLYSEYNITNVNLDLVQEGQQCYVRIIKIDDDPCDDYDVQKEMIIRERISSCIFPNYNDEE